MKKTLVIIAVLIVLLVNVKNTSNEVIIPDDSIRFRIISNSENKIDYTIKLKLKKILENQVYDVVKDAKSKEETSRLIKENIPKINNIIKDTLKNDNYEISYGKNYFPAKIFKGVIYNEGYYDSLVITIGKGEGENWWCVLFPPLCLLEDNENTTDVEYKIFASRIIDSFK